MPVSKKTRGYYMNPQVMRHLEEEGGKPSIAKEMHKAKNQPKNIKVDPSVSPLFNAIPKRETN
jgi:hypothetical protein